MFQTTKTAATECKTPLFEQFSGKFKDFFNCSFGVFRNYADEDITIVSAHLLSLW